MVQEFDKEDIEQSIHPMVTVTPHLRNAIGVQFASGDNVDMKPLLYPETALPARRVAQYFPPKDGGDVFILVCEGTREIKVTKPEPKPNDGKPGKVEEDIDGSDLDSEEEDEEETREVVWKADKPIAELAVRGIRPGGKAEVMIHVNADLGLQVTAREVGGQNAARGVVEAPKTVENGSA